MENKRRARRRPAEVGCERAISAVVTGDLDPVDAHHCAPVYALEDQPVRLYVLGIIYGVLLGMLVYNLFIYLSVRDTGGKRGVLKLGENFKIDISR